MKLFNQFRFETPENVELEFTLAGIGSRAYALFIDYSILFALQIIYWLCILIFPDLIGDILTGILLDKKNVELWVFAILTLIFFFVYVGYFIFFETTWQGQTPGKKFVKIRVIRDDGRPIRIQQATLRALLRPIDDLFGLGIFFIIFSKSEKRIGDWVAGTIVIEEKKTGLSAEFPITEEGQKLAVVLKTEADLSRLRPEDFAVIREYLKRRDGMIIDARIELAKKLAHQVKDRLGLETVPANVTPNLFLEGVYLAYQNQASRSYTDQ